MYIWTIMLHTYIHIYFRVGAIGIEKTPALVRCPRDH